MKNPLLIVVLFLLQIQHLHAIENHPAGARSVALSHAYVSFSDIWSTFHNQAGLSYLQKVSAGFFYESRFMIDELSTTAGTVVLPMKPGILGVSFFQFGKGSFKENKVGLAYARQLTRQLHAGIQLDYFIKTFPENQRAKGFATFEGGIIYSPSPRIFLGAHAFNPIMGGIQTLSGKQKMPLVIRVGGHYHFEEYVLITVETQKDTQNLMLVKTGIEFSPVSDLFLRIGVSGKPIKYTAGIGYNTGEIKTDIGFSYHGNLGLTPSISVQFSL